MRKFYNLVMIFVLCLIPISVSAKDADITINFDKVYIEDSSMNNIQNAAWKYLLANGDIVLNTSISSNNSLGIENNDDQNTDIVGYSNKEGKILVLYDMTNKHYIVPNTVNSSDNLKVIITHDGVKDKGLEQYNNIFLNYGIEENNDKVLTFELFDDVSYYDLDRKENIVIDFLISKGLIEVQGEGSPVVIANEKSNKLFTYDDTQQKILVERGLNYKDNITYNLSKDDRNALDEQLGINSNYKQIELRLAPEEVKRIENPKTFNIIIFPVVVLLFSIVLMVMYSIKNKKDDQDA